MVISSQDQVCMVTNHLNEEYKHHMSQRNLLEIVKALI